MSRPIHACAVKQSFLHRLVPCAAARCGHVCSRAKKKGKGPQWAVAQIALHLCLMTASRWLRVLLLLLLLSLPLSSCFSSTGAIAASGGSSPFAVPRRTMAEALLSPCLHHGRRFVVVITSAPHLYTSSALPSPLPPPLSSTVPYHYPPSSYPLLASSPRVLRGASWT